MPTTVDIESQRMLVGTTPVRRLYQGTNLRGTRIAELFANGEQGVWYDPSDLSTLFQDAAGTIPVTGVEQPVGCMLDKSGRGNHASQATTTARPILRARYNLLTQTENLGHADWPATQQGTKCTVEQVQAPDGSMTAQKLTALVYPVVPSRTITVQGTTFRYVVWLKPGIITVPRALVRNNTTAVNMINANTADTSISNQYGNCVVTPGPDGWKKFSFTVTSGISPGDAVSLYYGWTGSVQIGDTWSVWHPDFRYLNDAFNNPEYQRVGDATDYDTTGFPYYLQFDGVDDHLSILSLDFSGASSAVAVIGMEKLSDVASTRPYTHGESLLTGAFLFLAPANPGQASLRAAVRSVDGTLSQTTGADNKPAPIKTVMLASYGNGESTTVRFNGSETRVASGGPLAGLVLPNTRAIVGARVVSDTTQTNFFVGRISGLLHIGRSLSEGERRAVERFINNKSRAY